MPKEAIVDGYQALQSNIKLCNVEFTIDSSNFIYAPTSTVTAAAFQYVKILDG